MRLIAQLPSRQRGAGGVDLVRAYGVAPQIGVAVAGGDSPAGDGGLPSAAADGGGGEPYVTHQLQQVGVDPPLFTDGTANRVGLVARDPPAPQHVGPGLLHGGVCRPAHPRRRLRRRDGGDGAPVGEGRVTPGPSGRSPVRGDIRVTPHSCPPTRPASVGLGRPHTARLYTMRRGRRPTKSSRPLQSIATALTTQATRSLSINY